MVKCVFININQLTQVARYYSAPILFHGYEFYFFLRLQNIGSNDPDNQDNLKLAGYLRCMSKIPEGAKHRLPVCSTVVILEDDEKVVRSFAPSSVILEANEKAIGGSLMLGEENWQQVKTVNCPIVINDKVTVKVTVEFLPDEDGCLLVNEIRE